MYGIAVVEKNRAGELSLVESSYCGTDWPRPLEREDVLWRILAAYNEKTQVAAILMLRVPVRGVIKLRSVCVVLGVAH
jgi:hypothetical protein